MDPIEINGIVGQRIRFFCKAKGYTLQQLAAILHRSKSVLSKYERGEISIDIAALYEIACALGVGISDLMDFGVEHPRSLLHPEMDAEEQTHRLYCYTYGGHKRALRKHILLMGETTASFYSEVKDESDLTEYLYFYRGEVQRTTSFCRLLLLNPVHENDIAILEYQTPLKQASQYLGILCSFSIGTCYPIAVKILLSETPVTDAEQLRSILEFSREDVKAYRAHSSFFVTG